MVEQFSNFQLDVRVSPKPILITIGLAGILFILLAVTSREPSNIMEYDLLAACFFLFAWGGWTLLSRYPDLTRWLIACGFVAAFFMPWFLFRFSGLWANVCACCDKFAVTRVVGRLAHLGGRNDIDLVCVHFEYGRLHLLYGFQRGWRLAILRILLVAVETAA